MSDEVRKVTKTLKQQPHISWFKLANSTTRQINENKGLDKPKVLIRQKEVGKCGNMNKKKDQIAERTGFITIIGLWKHGSVPQLKY